MEQAQTGESETADVLLTEEETVLAEYGELYLQNTDMVGWLSIAGTNINYPVMQTPNNPNYYLKHNFEKEYSDLAAIGITCRGKQFALVGGALRYLRW